MVKHKQLICPECDNEFWNEYDHKIDQETVKTYMCNGCELEIVKEPHFHLKIFLRLEESED